MYFLDQYYKNIVKYDLINKFNYKNLKNIPKIKKIILNFGCKNPNMKQLTISLLALELITGKKGSFTQAKSSNILLKIRKGNLVGCKLVLQKNLMYNFLTKLITEILPQMKTSNKIALNNKLNNTTAVSYKISNTLIFPEFEKNYYLLNDLPNLHITFLTNTKSHAELIYLLNSFKLPTFFYKKN